MTDALKTAAILPETLTLLRQQVAEAMSGEDEAAHEVLDTLSIAWIAAERWRIERHEAGSRDAEVARNRSPRKL